MFKNLQMLNKELQDGTKYDSEQMSIVASPAQMPQNPMLPAVYIGQVLYRERTGKYANGEITEHTVTKIDRKYFECTCLNNKINVSDLMYENKMYSQDNYRLYITKQEIFDKNELSILYAAIQSSFSHYSNKKFTLDELRKVSKILGCL